MIKQAIDGVLVIWSSFVVTKIEMRHLAVAHDLCLSCLRSTADDVRNLTGAA
jgi:hypothetical protein